MAAARDPWWVIGSAAVWLHDRATTVADVDVLASVCDADRLFGLRQRVADPADRLFRSARFGSVATDALPIEIMADLCVKADGTWRPVTPRTRCAVQAGNAVVFMPGRVELIGILRLFGRPKDAARAALLERDGAR